MTTKETRHRERETQLHSRAQRRAVSGNRPLPGKFSQEFAALDGAQEETPGKRAKCVLQTKKEYSHES
ncbi:hypothetical protein SBBP1_40039 [Burkholderiales bacterium]|nr:hypothetical protein SBBP1_40039 [Burkholderiales bacterium]